MSFEIGDFVINKFDVTKRIAEGEFGILIGAVGNTYKVFWPKFGERGARVTGRFLENELILIQKGGEMKLNPPEKIEVAINNRIPAIDHIREHCEKTFGIYPGLKDTKDFVDKLLETKDRAEAIESLKAMLKSGKDSNKFTKGQVVGILDEIFT